MKAMTGWGTIVGQVAVLFLSSPLTAQQPPDTTLLDPVVITAERVATTRTSTPATVRVLTGEELQARGIRTLSDALRDVAGLTIARTGSYGGQTSWFLRGGESDYVKVLIDGVPINDPGGAIDLADLTTDNVERVEIVRGPVSVLYGSDAVSGVVQIFTKRGRGATRGDLGFRMGSYTAIEALGGVSGGTEDVSYSVSASRATTDGLYPVNSRYRNIVWSGLLRATPDERTEAKVGVRYIEGQYHYPTDGTGQIVDQNAFQRRNRISAVLDLGRYFTSTIEGRLLFALNQLDGGTDDQPDGPSDTLGYYGYSSVQTVLRRSAEARVNAYGPLQTVVTAGVQLEEERERSATETLSEWGASSNSFDATRLSVGYYTQLRSNPIRSLDFTIGARLDDNEAFGTFLSYRAGTSFRFETGTRLHVSVGRAFKEPTFYENFAASPFARGNPDLLPERSVAWEAGVEQQMFGDHIAAGFVFFSQGFRDLIQYTFAAPNPEDPNFYNIAAADARGFEIEALGTPGYGTTIRAGYTYLHTEVLDSGFDDGPGASFVEGERLLRRPTHTFSVFVAQEITSRAQLTGTLRYVGDRDDRDFSTYPAQPIVMSSYTTIDISAKLSVWRGVAGRPAIDVTARVANVLDVDYQEVFGFLTPGRTVVVGVRAGL